MSKGKPILVTGDRPTGRLHLGHLVGSLLNRIKFQDDYDCHFLVADLHMLTTHYDKVGEAERNTPTVCFSSVIARQSREIYFCL